MRDFTSYSAFLSLAGLLSAGCLSGGLEDPDESCRATLTGSVGAEAVNEAWIGPTVLRATSGETLELDVADDARRLFFFGTPDGAVARGEAFLFGPGALGGGSRVIHASAATTAADDWDVPFELGELTDLGPWPGQPMPGEIQICTMSGMEGDAPRCQGHAASLTGELDGESRTTTYSAARQMAAGDSVVAELYGPEERVVALVKSGFALVLVTRVADGARSLYTASSVTTTQDPFVAKLGSLAKLPAPPGVPVDGKLTLERCPPRT